MFNNEYRYLGSWFSVHRKLRKMFLTLGGFQIKRTFWYESRTKLWSPERTKSLINNIHAYKIQFFFRLSLTQVRWKVQFLKSLSTVRPWKKRKVKLRVNLTTPSTWSIVKHEQLTAGWSSPNVFSRMVNASCSKFAASLYLFWSLWKQVR